MSLYGTMMATQAASESEAVAVALFPAIVEDLLAEVDDPMRGLFFGWPAYWSTRIGADPTMSPNRADVDDDVEFNCLCCDFGVLFFWPSLLTPVGLALALAVALEGPLGLVEVAC
jgi:hypothetical protein